MARPSRSPRISRQVTSCPSPSPTATARRPPRRPRRCPATWSAWTPTTVSVRVTVGPDVDTTQLEQRIIQPDFVGTAVGKRDIRALPGGPGRRTSRRLHLRDRLPHTDGSWPRQVRLRHPRSWPTSRWPADLGERAMNWNVQDADGNRQALTIAEFGEAGGPGMGGCPPGPGQQGGTRRERHRRSLPINTPSTMVVNWTPAAAPAGRGRGGRLQRGGRRAGARQPPANIVGRRLAASATSTTLTGSRRAQELHGRGAVADRHRAEHDRSVPDGRGRTRPRRRDASDAERQPHGRRHRPDERGHGEQRRSGVLHYRRRSGRERRHALR